ncbi:MAG: hypothetical protein ACYTF3_03290 [Planctomycetota bacterium]|jgi:hypothetical protein
MTKPLTLAACALAAGLCTSVAVAQSESPIQDPVAKALGNWQEDHGSNWRLTEHIELTTGRFLWGGTRTAPFTPQEREDWFELARQAFDETYDIFQVADVTLEPHTVKYLTLQQIGTTDKVSVELHQVVRGVEVRDASVHALFTPQGDLLALDSKALPGVEDLAVRPANDRWAAVDAAMAEYWALEGREPSSVGQPELHIIKTLPGKLWEPRLAWSVELRNDEDPSRPAARRMFIAADGDYELLEAEQLIHYQASGSVESWATPGTRANSGSNPPTLQPMRFMTVTSAAGNATTDVNGDFTIPGATGPTTVTASYTGPWVRVINNAGANHSASGTFNPGTPGTLTMNAAQTEFVTSEASCFDSVIDFREWLKSIDPADTSVDFQITANANLNSTCNAFYNGVSINMYRSGSGCNNTGFSTVVAHEEGHWANDLYSSGNGPDGFGEGNADVWAMYIYDTPIVGEDFFSGGGFIRTGLNTRQFCGDSNTGCYGQVHADGEVLMGALWKVRDRLNQTLGNAAGDLTADTLHVAWMNAYNDGSIRTIIEEHWLALDDNDGDIFNGTPNYGDIDGGFRAQGFPGVDLQLISIAHTPLGNSLDEAGPYVVDADISSLIGNVITGADVVYSVDGGSPQTVAMVNTGGSTWSGDIPGQVSPSTVSYHIEAFDSGSNSEDFPRDAELSFVVGVETQIYFNDFEGATDEGWTHVQISTQDDWQRGTPAGKVEDPGAAYSGLNCWGNDLGPSGFNGAYQPNVNNYLESPAIDCSGQTNVKLRFARWLAVEESRYDTASIEVNGTTVWTNPFAGNLIDTSWSIQELDISQWADNNPSVVVRFRMVSDGGLEFGGWNIDDFELVSLEPVPGGGRDVINLVGDTIGFRGNNVSYTFTGMQPGAQWAFLAGLSNSGSVILGKAFDIGAGYQVVGTGTADALGAGTLTFQVPNSLPASTTGYFEVGAQSALGVDESNLLTILIL